MMTPDCEPNPAATTARTGALRLWLSVSRPRFWLYLGGTWLVGYTAGATRLSDLLRPAFIAGLAWFLVPANLLLYGLNDLADRDTDRRNPKKGSREHLLSDGETRLTLGGVILSGSLAVPLAAFALNRVETLLLALFLLLAFAYSVPPLRLKARPALDSASNALYALPAFIGFHVAAARFPSAAIVIACCLWTAAMHLFSAIPDITSDREAGLSTSATALGERGAAAACFALWSCAVGLFISRGALMPWSSLGVVYPALALYAALHPPAVPRLYWSFPYLNAAAGALAFFILGARL